MFVFGARLIKCSPKYAQNRRIFGTAGGNCNWIVIIKKNKIPMKRIVRFIGVCWYRSIIVLIGLFGFHLQDIIFYYSFYSYIDPPDKFRRFYSEYIILHSGSALLRLRTWKAAFMSIAGAMLTKPELTPSMSRRGNPYDNALAENFFSILKTECIYRTKIKTFADARRLIDDYIYFYYHQRIQIKTKLTPLELRSQLINWFNFP